ncbi:Calcium-binding protein CML19 [Thelohanellus kitauei]|uniref:Calcium-binding protein CML19 n=1 Tax=Thelohanellus kitauei TaxID=669202 RepID=A0A0C2IV49_THEKT|nr:Calcium-binding protein CML19 [Thelohanellus kitauei]
MLTEIRWMSEDNVKDFKVCFETVDAEKLGLLLEQLGYQFWDGSTFESICSKYCNENEYITLDGCLNMIRDEKIFKSEGTAVSQIFRLFDFKSKGKVNKQDLLSLSEELKINLSEEDADVSYCCDQIMIQEADLNGDGMVDLYEFGKLMNRIKVCKD